MKKIILFFSVLIFACILNAQIQVISSGNVGIGTNANSTYKFNLLGSCYFSGGHTYFTDGLTLSTTIGGPTSFVIANSSYPGMALTSGSSYNSMYMLWAGGDAFSIGSWVSSDLQLKNNISALDGKLMLSKIMNLDGKKYKFKNNEELDQVYKNNNIGNDDSEKSYKLTNLPKGERYGFIAQEIEKEFPELVSTDKTTNLKAIDYDGMIPILLQSIKEQQKMIIQLQEQLNSINVISKEEIQNRITKNDAFLSSENSLNQNAPNPFSQKTIISYYLNEETKNARICLYDMNGTQIRSINVNGFGQGNIVIDAKQLKAGIYLYSLIVDGNLVDTKRMVLTDLQKR